jgi:hypothetical protein
MALGYDTTLRNSRLDAVSTRAGANARLRIYSGTRPTTGAAIGGATLLADLACGSTFAPPASGGVLTLNPITSATAAATGTATWFRITQSNGTTFVADGQVTGTGGSGDLRLSTTSIVQGGTVSVSSFSITAANE